MRYALLSFVIAALSAQVAVSHPFVKRTIDDFVVLNYALTLEHLENAFYTGGLAKYNEKAFEAAGFKSGVRNRYLEISAHEAAHVAVLTKALGANATKACTYSFPYTDVKSFIALSQIFEGVGTSAYTGASQFISSKANLIEAASILATEARQASWISSSVNNGQPWGSSFEIPLSLNEGFSLASAFITSCPSTNPSLPLHAYPALTLKDAVPGKQVTVETSANATYIAFYFELSTIFVAIDKGEVTVPKELAGQVYAVATTSGTEVTDENTVAGPAVLLFELDPNDG